jgi:hypothetical protein
MAAVKQNGFALEFVKDQTIELCQAAVDENVDAMKFVKPDFLNRVNVSTHIINPTVFTVLPTSVTIDDLTDPITLDSPKSGEVYGFLVEGDKWHLAGSLSTFNEMIENRFQGSSKGRVFVPIKNVLVATELLRWVKL